MRSFSAAARYTEQSVTASDPPAERKDSASLVRKESAGEGTARHQPDYSVAVDYRTSYVSVN